jgi:uncharacterized protein (TIGR02680 family)
LTRRYGIYLRTYRTFVRRRVRLAAEELRKANSTVEDEAGRVDAIQQTLEHARRERERLDEEQAHAREEKDALAGRLDVARHAPEMRTVERIEQARSEARQTEEVLRDAEDDLARASRDAEAVSQELAGAKRDLQPVRDQLARANRDAGQAAKHAGVDVLHHEAVTSMQEDPDQTARHLRLLARAKRDQVDELKALVDRIAPLDASVRTVRDQVGDAEAAFETAREVCAAADATADQAGVEHVQAIQTWHSCLRELGLTPDERGQMLERAHDLEYEPLTLLAAARQRAGTALDQAVAPLLAAIDRLQAEIRGLDDAIYGIARRREIAPAPPAVRTADRSERPGAPFYRCVEFATSLPDSEAALLEAGLEASGILDAWVWPDGRIESELIDTVLLAAEPVERSLATSLVPVAGAVPAPIIEGIVRSIGNSPAAASFAAVDGRWRLGALQGRAFKPAAEYVGAAAREQARQRRLAQLAAQRNAAEAELDERQQALGVRRDRRQRLYAEAGSYPSRSAYRQAHLRAARANAEFAAVTGQLRQLRAHEEQLAAQLRELDAVVRSRAAELSLSGHIDHLPELLHALRNYEEHVTALYMAASKFRNLSLAADKAQQRVQIEQQRRDHEGGKVEKRRRERERARARAQAHELEASAAGQAAIDALERVDALKAALRTLEAGIDERANSIVAAGTEVGEASGRLLELKGQHQISSERRAHAAAVITSLVERGVVDLALGTELAGNDDWSMTRALLLARQQIEPALASEPIHPEALNSAQNHLTAAFSELKSTLHAYAPSLQWHENIPQTTAIYNQLPVDIRVLRQRLHDEVEGQRRLLSEKEKDIFEQFLMADLANHLRDRILRARQQVQDINANLRAHPTNSGMTLSLRLTEEVEDSNEKLALEHLMKDPSLLRDHERELLRQFFQGRIAAARVQAGNQTWREHLSEALDYRGWHHMTIHQHQDGRTTAFTDARYAAGSGGEKSVSIHQPLFAAAATYYNSATSGFAPRLIVLDEAFAGIDFPTRGRCLEMAVQFDLDLVMTSYEEMGTHAELPALAIYQMVRDPGRRGVYCERWVWNGQQLQQAAGA